MRDFRSTAACLLGLGLGLLTATALAADVAISPPPGAGFSVTDTSGNNTRLRVEESGAVSVPGLPSAPQQDTPQCFNSSTGAMGPCAPTAAFSASKIEYVDNSAHCTYIEGSTQAMKPIIMYCPANRYVVSGGCYTNIVGSEPLVIQSGPYPPNGNEPAGWYCNARCYSDAQTVYAAILCAP